MQFVFISLNKKRQITSENYTGYISGNLSKAISEFKKQHPQEPLETWNVYMKENNRSGLKWRGKLSDFKEDLNNLST
jgi:hypothetical protein